MKRKVLIALACVMLLPLLAFGALFAIREPPDSPRVEAVPGVVGVEAGGAYAWLVSSADALNADVVGADRAAFERLGKRYLRFR